MRKKYSDTFKSNAVEQVQNGSRASEVAKQCGASVYSIRDWVKQADEAKNGPMRPEERAEIKRLRRELRIAKEDVQILKKAAAYFAKEQS